MRTIKVRAKVNGYHPLTGITLVRGQEYSIRDDQFGSRIFSRIEARPPGTARKRTTSKKGRK